MRKRSPRSTGCRSAFVSFAWGEPDCTVRSGNTSDRELAWRLLPPHLCLQAATAAQVVPVSEQDEARGSLWPVKDLLFGEFEGELLLARDEIGEGYRLSGIGAEFWRSILAGEPAAETAERLSRVYDVDAGTVCTNLEGFTRTLLQQGWLQPAGAADGDGQEVPSIPER